VRNVMVAVLLLVIVNYCYVDLCLHMK